MIPRSLDATDFSGPDYSSQDHRSSLRSSRVCLPKRLEELRGKLIAQIGMDKLGELLRSHNLMDNQGNLTYSKEALPEACSGLAVLQLRALYFLTRRDVVVFSQSGVMAVEWPAWQRVNSP